VQGGTGIGTAPPQTLVAALLLVSAVRNSVSATHGAGGGVQGFRFWARPSMTRVRKQPLILRQQQIMRLKNTTLARDSNQNPR
jgi:hypothetical protein